MHAESGDKYVFRDARVSERFGSLDAHGALMLADERPRVDTVARFDVCELDGRKIAVFLDCEERSAEWRDGVRRGAPGWMDSVVFAALNEEGSGSADVVVDAPHGADQWRCAVASVCVLLNDGRFSIEPSVCRVVMRGGGVVVVRADFDWERECWIGAAWIEGVAP